MYLDGSATTKPSSLAMNCFSDISANNWNNPSSPSEDSRATKVLLEDSRRIIAREICCEPENIFFTSGSTEGANWIMQSFVPRGKESECALIVSEIEHPCVWETAKYLESCGVNVNYLPVDKYGVVSLLKLNDLLLENYHYNRKTLVCIADGNNEIGTIQPTEMIADLVHQHDAYLFTDMTQSFAHAMSVEVDVLGYDFACASAHKFGGFKGVGFVYMREPLPPLLHGGHQENNCRAGTENVAGIVAMAKQFEVIRDDMLINYIQTNMKSLYLKTLLQLRIAGVKINGSVQGIPDIVSVTLPEGDANTIISLLDDQYNIQISAGSACSSGENKPSRILKAIGLTDEETRRTLRITVDKDCEDEFYEELVEDLAELVNMTKGG